jgi:hypothetical protein
MDSQTAIVSPAQVTRFAETLEESTKKLRIEGRKMRESTNAARVVWKDQKYTTFHRQLEHCIEELEKFNKTSLKYAEFLREKAMLANKYLHRR